MGWLSREEVERASFRDSELWEFGVTESGRAVYLMFDGASWDDAFIDRTIQLKIHVRDRVDIARSRGRSFWPCRMVMPTISGPSPLFRSRTISCILRAFFAQAKTTCTSIVARSRKSRRG